MAFPPVPESPNRQLPSKSSGTPRVGMHLYQNDDDDDVSVLTFHTISTKDAAAHIHHHAISGGSNSSFVKTARESLERLILERSNSVDDDGKSLSRISEEGGSQFSSSCNSKRGCDQSKSSSVKSSNREKSEGEEEEEDNDGDEYDYGNDDDTISLAESILSSANKVLYNVGSSPYYAGRSRKPSSPTREPSLPRPRPKHLSPMKQPEAPYYTRQSNKPSSPVHEPSLPQSSRNRPSPTKQHTETSYYNGKSKKTSSPAHESPLPPQCSANHPSQMKQPTKINVETADENESCSKNIYSMKNELPKKKAAYEHNDQLEVSSNFLSSYFDDENTKPTMSYSNHHNTNKSNATTAKFMNRGGGQYETKDYNNEHVRKLESETKHLQLILKEKQLETKKASQSLGSSIKKANALLERISAGRMA